MNDYTVEIGERDKTNYINEGIVTITANIPIEEPDANGHIYSKEMIKKALKSVKKGMAVLGVEGEYIGKVVSEPEIDYRFGEPRIVSISVTALINDFTKMGGAVIEVDLKSEENDD